VVVVVVAAAAAAAGRGTINVMNSITVSSTSQGS